jgi:hypothetical protein
VAERVRAGNTVAKVIAIVSAIGEVEGLCDELKIYVLAELEVLRQAQVQFEERITAERVL